MLAGVLTSNVQALEARAAALEAKVAEGQAAAGELQAKLAASERQLAAAGKAAGQQAAARKDAAAEQAAAQAAHVQQLADATSAFSARLRKLRSNYFHVSNPGASSGAARCNTPQVRRLGRHRALLPPLPACTPAAIPPSCNALSPPPPMHSAPCRHRQWQHLQQQQA